MAYNHACRQGTADRREKSSKSQKRLYIQNSGRNDREKWAV